MTPYRRETNALSNQPVKFYKIIALSFLVITIILLGSIVFMSAKRATITVVTKAAPVEATFSVGVGEAEAPRTILGFTATTTVGLEKKFSPTGTKKEPGIAEGIIIIHNDSDTGQPLVATTRFLSPDNVLFRLKNSVVVPAGGTLDALVYADQEGEEGNIAPTKFTIPGLNEDKQKVVYGESTSPMSGGIKTVGILTSEDVEKAKQELLEQAKGEAEKKLAKYVEDRTAVYSVISSEVNSSEELGDEVSEFNLSLNAEVVGVFYDSTGLDKMAQAELMNKAVSDADLIDTGGNSPEVAIESFTNGRVTLSVFYSGVISLNPESEQIEKTVFFGKSRDEIRRYVLSLDHVYSVEVKFTPAWIQSAPSVAEHVNVVVKSVK
jgi:hypothetical protein